MQIVYLIAGQGERDAISSSLSSLPCKIECFPNVAAFAAAPDIDRRGCLLIVAQPDEVDPMSRLRAVPEPLPTVVLSACCNVAAAVRAMKEGAADVVQEPVDPERLRAAVAAALAESRARVERAERMADLCARFRSLSARERDVVGAVLDGRGNREVAAQLGIKPRTVEVHRANAMNKLGARTLADLVRIWLDVDETAARLTAD
jgi:two-component system, LuxR family, response regulator FixJ